MQPSGNSPDVNKLMSKMCIRSENKPSTIIFEVNFLIQYFFFVFIANFIHCLRSMFTLEKTMLSRAAPLQKIDVLLKCKARFPPITMKKIDYFI